jgi:hypothetical protein
MQLVLVRQDFICRANDVRDKSPSSEFLGALDKPKAASFHEYGQRLNLANHIAPRFEPSA